MKLELEDYSSTALKALSSQLSEIEARKDLSLHGQLSVSGHPPHREGSAIN